MKAPLIPCPACQRHVRLGAPSCPFCGGDTAELGDAALSEVGSARLSSLAVMTFRATALGVALAANACGGETGPKPPPATGGAPAQGGSDSGVSGGGAGGSGGTLSVGGATNAGGFGGSVPIYRATPRG